MVCIRNRIRLVRIGESPRLVKNIEYKNCLASARRGGIACVADSHAYALLDVANQQKIPLFPISSLDNGADFSQTAGQPESMPISTGSQGITRSASSSRPKSGYRDDDVKGHSRSTSLGTILGGLGKPQSQSRSRSRERTGLEPPDQGGRPTSPLGGASPTRASSLAGTPDIRPSTPEKALPPVPNAPQSAKFSQSIPRPTAAILKPHICSPSPAEFLLTTGTLPDEGGVGMFVNLDGDVVRGTLEFSQYPSEVIVDSAASGNGNGLVGNKVDDRDYVLASMEKTTETGREGGIEIQSCTMDSGDAKEWLTVISEKVGQEDDIDLQDAQVGVGTTLVPALIALPEVGEKLRARRWRVPRAGNHGQVRDEVDLPSQPAFPKRGSSLANVETQQANQETIREKQEDEFARRLGETSTSVVSWSGADIWWTLRNPLILKLDATIDGLVHTINSNASDRGRLINISNSIKDQEAKTETEFLSLKYIRQKISLVLFAKDLLEMDPRRQMNKGNQRATQTMLLEGGIDPRVLISLVPLLQSEIHEGPEGIWIHAGLINVLTQATSELSRLSESSYNFAMDGILDLLKKYLFAWRDRKGFGSIADEKEVFQTVDGALIHLLLYQFEHAPAGPTSSTSIRTELYSVVDHGVDCFDHAVALLEEHHQLYVLSRLFQSRKLTSQVLFTWRRIIEGEHDSGGGLVDGENEMRKYIVKQIKAPQVFEEYATWLAARAPQLGVQIFTDPSSRVKLPPNQVVQLLKSKAPDAVKVYLEHLVFGTHNIRYANDLISYYLDAVISVLESCPSARDMLAESYSVYKALQPPKPTYRQFITENAISDPWWHDRLRLLELIGGSHGAGFSYDLNSVLQRVEPWEESLVPESIILDGRQGRHQPALRLLTHGLGDYHTAINYCLLGGSSIFHPTTPSTLSQEAEEEGQNGTPTHAQQVILFAYLLPEFLRIQDETDRLERTSELLARFSSFFDVFDVLPQIPDDWSVDLLAGFLVAKLREAVSAGREASVVKALSGSENLQMSVVWAEKCEGFGARIVDVDGEVEVESGK